MKYLALPIWVTDILKENDLPLSTVFNNEVMRKYFSKRDLKDLDHFISAMDRLFISQSVEPTHLGLEVCYPHMSNEFGCGGNHGTLYTPYQEVSVMKLNELILGQDAESCTHITSTLGRRDTTGEVRPVMVSHLERVEIAKGDIGSVYIISFEYTLGKLKTSLFGEIRTSLIKALYEAKCDLSALAMTPTFRSFVKDLR